MSNTKRAKAVSTTSPNANAKISSGLNLTNLAAATNVAAAQSVQQEFKTYVEVQMGDRTFRIDRLKTRASDEWRDKLGASGLWAKVLEGIKQVLPVVRNGENVQMSEIADLLPQVLPTIQEMLLGGMREMRGLLFNYAASLRDEEEWVLNNAYDEQIVAAFVEVVQLAFPFGRVLSYLSGLSQRPTKPNSSTPNTES